MQPIAHWLNALGLGQYAQRFADNDIDASILRDLTDTRTSKKSESRSGIARKYCARLQSSMRFE
jgi:hypothetical protein